MAALNPSLQSPSGVAWNPGVLEGVASQQLLQIRSHVDAVLEKRAPNVRLITPDEAALTLHTGRSEQLGKVLSPTQVSTFLSCSARWWFRYGRRLPESKTSALALGSAVHSAVEANFRAKIDSGEDLQATGVIALFRDAWADQVKETEFFEDEDPDAIRNKGEELIQKFMDEAAPTIKPAAVELDVKGTIAGIEVRGRVDLLDVDGCIIDVKTAARKPTSISPQYALQLATYRQITPGASGEARLDTLVKTKAVQLVQQSYTVGGPDLRATACLFPMVQEGIRTGLYLPNRGSLLCSRRHCSFWRQCEAEFGGTVKAS